MGNWFPVSVLVMKNYYLLSSVSSLLCPVQAEQDVDTATSEVDFQPRSSVKVPTLSYPIQAEQNGLNGVAVYQPVSPTRCDSVPSLGASMQTQTQQEHITVLKSEVKRLKNLLSLAMKNLQSERETQQQLRSQHELHEHERTILQEGTEKRDIKIQQLEKSNAWLEQRLIDTEKQLEVLVHEDQFDRIYRFVEAKSNTLVEGDRCIICDNVPDKCMHCDRPVREHRQTRLNHKFKAQGKEDKCNSRKQDGELCGQPEAQHHDLGHSFKVAGLCQSHLYPRGVLEAVCKGNNSWIYDGVDHTSRTPNDCKRRLICALCEPATSKLEESLIERMKSKHDIHTLRDDDKILFSVLAYRSMIFSLYHYQKDCCNHYRTDVKSIIQYGWSYHYHLRRSPTDDIQPVPPVLLHLESSRHEFLHFPAVCVLDFTETNPPPPPKLGNTVVAIYGCIPPYHFVLLRDLDTARELQPYSRQIIRSINNRLSDELETYYDENEGAKKWLKGQRKQSKLGQHWWPVLTIRPPKCCLKIQVHRLLHSPLAIT